MSFKKPGFKNLQAATENIAKLLKQEAEKLKETTEAFIKVLEAKEKAKSSYIRKKRD